jgi:hypothetical protein
MNSRAWRAALHGPGQMSHPPRQILGRSDNGLGEKGQLLVGRPLHGEDGGMLERQVVADPEGLPGGSDGSSGRNRESTPQPGEPSCHSRGLSTCIRR